MSLKPPAGSNVPLVWSDFETRLTSAERGLGVTVAAATGVSATDSTSIWDAIQAADAAGGGRVVVPPGTYLCNTHKGSAPNGSGGAPRSVFYAVGIDNVHIVLLPGAVIQTTLADAATILEVKDSANVEIRGGKWVGNANRGDASNANVRGSAIRFTNVAAGTIADGEFTNFDYSTIYLTAGSRYCIVRDNYLYDNTANGHGINEDDFPATGAYVSTPPIGNLITGNRLDNMGGFAIACDSPGAQTFTQVTDNFIDGTQSYAGIKVNSGDTRIQGNEIRNTNWQGIDAGGSGALANTIRRLRILDNTLVNCGNSLRGDISDYSPAIWVAASSTTAPENIVVARNTIDSPGKHGIYTLDITGLKIHGNEITNTQHSGHGIYVVYDVSGRNRLRVTENDLVTIAGDGIFVAPTTNLIAQKGGVISKNQITGCVNGINIKGLAQDKLIDYTVLGNLVVDPSGLGLTYDATRVISQGNIVDATSAVAGIRSSASIGSRIWSIGDILNGTYSVSSRSDQSGQIVWLSPDPSGLSANRAGTFASTTFALESGANIRATRSIISARATQTLAANGAVTIDASLGNYHEITLQANATSSTISFSYSTSSNYIGMEMTILWRQDGTGSRTYAWPTNCKFAGAAAPTATTTANRADLVTFRFDGTNWNEISRSVALG